MISHEITGQSTSIYPHPFTSVHPSTGGCQSASSEQQIFLTVSADDQVETLREVLIPTAAESTAIRQVSKCCQAPPPLNCVLLILSPVLAITSFVLQIFKAVRSHFLCGWYHLVCFQLSGGLEKLQTVSHLQTAHILWGSNVISRDLM